MALIFLVVSILLLKAGSRTRVTLSSARYVD
jgi:hypothetical protein